MVVDVVFPGWMPWRRFALAQDIPGYFAQVEEIRKMDWDTFVGGHVARTGTHADVDVQAEFNRDVKQAADVEMHAALDVNIPNYASAIVTTDQVVNSISSM